MRVNSEERRRARAKNGRRNPEQGEAGSASDRSVDGRKSKKHLRKSRAELFEAASSRPGGREGFGLNPIRAVAIRPTGQLGARLFAV